MNDQPAIDVQTESETQALTVRDAVGAVERAVQPQQQQPAQQITAAQAKVEAVAHLTMQAYQRASMLQLTPEESKALQADFPDEAFKSGAAGKENLIYIEHAFLRDRMNTVFGLGQWSIVPRNRWAEDYRTASGKQASRVYVEAMLLIRGCFVAEAVGDMSYFLSNDAQNYGDAVEGAKTAALRRCAKELGIGLQAWKKDWCNGWWARQNAKAAEARSQTRQQPPPTQRPPASAPAPASKPAAASAPASATEEFFPIVTILAIKEAHSKPDAPKKWTAYFIKFSDGFGELEAATFDTKIAALANDLANTGENALLITKPGRKEGSKEIVKLSRAEQPPQSEPTTDNQELIQENMP